LDDDPDEEEIQIRFGWVLVLEMFIFFGHAYFCYKNSLKLKEKYAANKTEGTLYKFHFTRLLGFGSLVRGISLIFMVLVHSPSESSGLLLVEYFFITFPCLLWLPSYFAIILFFEKINYLITGENNTMTQPVLRSLFWMSFVIYFWFFLRSVISFSENSYRGFVSDASWLTGILYLILAAGIFIFGQKIVWTMKQHQEENESPMVAQNIKNVRILTIFCAVVFAIRGLFNILTISDVEISRKYLVETLHVWHGFLFLISELAPALAATYLTSKQSSENRSAKSSFELGPLTRNDSNERARALLSNI